MYQGTGQYAQRGAFRDGALGLGAIERRSPLPAGRYRLTVFDNNGAAFQSWLTASRGTVRVYSTETHAADPGTFDILANFFSDQALPTQGSVEYAFQVSSPTPPPSPTTFGYPDIIPSSESLTPTQPNLPSSSSSSAQATSAGVSHHDVLLGAGALVVTGVGFFLAWHARKEKRQ